MSAAAALPARGAASYRVRMAGPEGWELVPSAGGQSHAWAVPDDGVSPVRSGLELRVVREPSAIEFAELRARHGAALLGELPGGRLVDVGSAAVAEGDASYALALSSDARGSCVTVEQWILPIGRWSITVTATLLSADYPALLHAVRDALDTLEVHDA